MSSTNQKVAASRTAVLVAVSLTIMKFIVGVMSGSLSVIASALDSTLDVLMSAVNMFAINHAERPADDCHPFGHGKFETLATFFQSLVICIVGSWVIFEGVDRLGTNPELPHLNSGIAVLFISVVVSFWLSRHLKKVSKETNSPALAADSLHYAMDVYSNAGLLAAIVLVKYTGMTWLDSIFSIGIGVYIISEAINLARLGLRDVLDAQLPEEVLSEIDEIIRSADDHHIDYHNLRTRNSGSNKHIDFHLTVCKHLTVQAAHDITERIEDDIRRLVPGSDIIVHLDPCQVRTCPGRDECDGPD